MTDSATLACKEFVDGGESRKALNGVLCLGIYSSGSTWIFNCVLALLTRAHPQRALRSVYMDSNGFEDLLPWIDADETPVIKSHVCGEVLMAAVHIRRMPIILSLRDPRDAIVSLMQRFGSSFESALELVAASGAVLPRASRLLPALVIRYEDGTISNGEALLQIDALLNTNLGAGDLSDIHQKLLPESVKAKILDTFGDATDVGVYDPTTMWHPRHVGDGRTGKHKESLSSEQIVETNSRMAVFNKVYGY